MFESAIYQEEQWQPGPNVDRRDEVHTCPDLGELVANPFLPSLHTKHARVIDLLRYTPGRVEP